MGVQGTMPKLLVSAPSRVTLGAAHTTVSLAELSNQRKPRKNAPRAHLGPPPTILELRQTELRRAAEKLRQR